MEKINVNGQEYVLASSYMQEAKDTSGLPYVIIRSYSSGVHAGYLSFESKDSRKVKLVNSRRLYHWDGAFTCTDLAIQGVQNPENCKFAQVLPMITIMEVCEIIPATEVARASIEEVPNHTF